MKRQTSLLRPRALALAAGTVAALVCGTASAQVTFTGFTNGCFGVGCTPESDESGTARTDTFHGLTYNNSSFSVISSSGFAGLGDAGQIAPSVNFNNLGSWLLTSEAFSYTGSSFTLRVSFTAPPGTTPDNALFNAAFVGNVSTTDNGGLFINFDNTPQAFSFDEGTFTLQVNDLSLAPPKTGSTLGMESGTILVTSVPEPETYALFLAGLGAVGFMARRRKT
jgi:hypothetical protein